MIFALQAAALDTYLLEIGAPGQVQVDFGYTRMADGASVDAAAVAEAADGVRFVLLGENHDQLAHHQMQADVIQALVERGRTVVVGFEMFDISFADRLAELNATGWKLEEIEERSGWKEAWGMEFSLYEPIFRVAAEHQLDLVALNVPRATWTRVVAREGIDALTPEQRELVPTIDVTNQDHRKVFEALIGGHPLEGEAGDNFYAAQVVWDEAMAAFARRAMEGRGPEAVLVILCGSGHTLYGQGIDWRLRRDTGERTLNVIGITGPGPRAVSRGIGDFVFLSPDGQTP